MEQIDLQHVPTLATVDIHKLSLRFSAYGHAALVHTTRWEEVNWILKVSYVLRTEVVKYEVSSFYRGVNFKCKVKPHKINKTRLRRRHITAARILELKIPAR